MPVAQRGASNERAPVSGDASRCSFAGVAYAPIAQRTTITQVPPGNRFTCSTASSSNGTPQNMMSKKIACACFTDA